MQVRAFERYIPLSLLNIVKIHFRLDIMDTNTMNPNQTARKEQSDSGPYCLQFRLPMTLSRIKSRRQVINGGKRVKKPYSPRVHFSVAEAA